LGARGDRKEKIASALLSSGSNNAAREGEGKWGEGERKIPQVGGSKSRRGKRGKSKAVVGQRTGAGRELLSGPVVDGTNE